MYGHRFDYPVADKTFVGDETTWLKPTPFEPVPIRISSAADAIMGARILTSGPDEVVPRQEHVKPHPSTVSPQQIARSLSPLAESPTDSDLSVATIELPAAISYKDPLFNEDINKDVMQSHPGNVHHPALALHRHLLSGVYFPEHLFHMLEDIDKRQTHFSHIVSWYHDSNLAFVIHKPDAFVSEVMPLYFRRRTKLTSFRRQLRNYGFLQQGKDSDGLIYYHENFRRDKPSLAQHLALKPTPTAKDTAFSLSSFLQMKKKSPRVIVSTIPVGLSQDPAPAVDTITLPTPLKHNLGPNIFPQRLFRMMEDIDKRQSHLSGIVSWHPDSDLAFVIHKPEAFVSEVLPLYFRFQTQLASFQRQLKNYGFLQRHLLQQYQKRKKGDVLIYYHENFRKDKPFLLPNVVLESSLAVERRRCSNFHPFYR